jgi:hypothetical protein
MNPSLLLIPDRYKAAKLYSQIPDSGAGDLTFARNSNATRVNSAGLIEKVRENLATYSSDFATAGSAIDATITTNTTTDPFGTTLADSLLEVAASGNHLWFRDFTVSSGVEVTFSIFVKSIGGRNVRVAGTTGTGSELAVVDLANGAILASTGQVSVTNAGSGWYRISVTAISTGTTVRFIAYAADGTSISYAGDITKGIFLFGHQLEYGVMTDYIPTTTAAVSVGITADIPRLDYTGGGCPSLLLEPERTNRARFSEQFDNAYWTKSGATILANAAVSPDGFQNADKLVEDAGVVQPSFFRLSIAGANVVHTNSIYAKAGERIWLVMNIGDGINSARAWFNLSAGVIGTVNAGLTAQIQDAGNGWYRCIITRSVVAFASTVIEYQIATSDGVEGYTGNGTSGLFIYGVQFEVGSYPTSYIPTLGSSVTRLADAASKTGISSLIGQTEGTLFVEFDATITGNASSYAGIALNNGTSSNILAFGYYQNGRIQAVAFVGGSLLVNIDLPAFALTTGNHKFALSYKLNDYVFYVDGVQVGSDTSATVPATSVLNLYDVVGANMAYSQVALFTTRLTNAELASLTSL